MSCPTTRTPSACRAKLRAALEAIHDDVLAFRRTTPAVDMAGLNDALTAVVADFEAGLQCPDHAQRPEAGHRPRRLPVVTVRRPGAQGCPNGMSCGLRGAQDTLRRCLLSVVLHQKMEFVPSAHVLVPDPGRRLPVLLVFLKTAGRRLESFPDPGVRLLPVRLCGVPDRVPRTAVPQGEGSVDDVSLFLLAGFRGEDLGLLTLGCSARRARRAPPAAFQRSTALGAALLAALLTIRWWAGRFEWARLHTPHGRLEAEVPPLPRTHPCPSPGRACPHGRAHSPTSTASTRPAAYANFGPWSAN